MAEKHIVRFWRGERSKYNFLKDMGALDPWTRYIVIDGDDTITEYFGENVISDNTGQLLPVNDIVSRIPSTAVPGDRYLFGHDKTNTREASYHVVTIGVKKDDNGEWATYLDFQEFDEKYGVRVKSKGLKNYILVDGVLKTYDDVDCGSF